MRKTYNDGLSKWQRYRQKLKNEGIINGHNSPNRDNKQRKRDYRKTPKGRASCLLHGYKRSDVNNNRGECTLTVEWIINNIFSKPCHYCGETDWLKIGCDRIDNSKPHTPDNVVPCCKDCNNERQKQNYDLFLKNKKGLTSPS